MRSCRRPATSGSMGWLGPPQATRAEVSASCTMSLSRGERPVRGAVSALSAPLEARRALPCRRACSTSSAVDRLARDRRPSTAALLIERVVSTITALPGGPPPHEGGGMGASAPPRMLLDLSIAASYLLFYVQHPHRGAMFLTLRDRRES